MNIFNALRVYAAKWNEKEVRGYTPEEIALVDRAEVVESQYGFSVMFVMRAGGQTYIPLDENSSATVGTSVDLTKVKLVTLQRSGDKDIYRVRL